MLLLDEPCSALDPISTATIEELIVGAARERRDRDRHAQPAAGVPRGRPRRVHAPRRAGRVRDRASRSSTGPRSSARATTSAGPSGESWRRSCSPRWRSPAARRPQEESAKLEQAAKRHEHEVGRQQALAQRALDDHAREHQGQGARAPPSCTATRRRRRACVTLRNTSARRAARRADRDHRQGRRAARSVYQNDSAGPRRGARRRSRSLPAHATLTWVDDQVHARAARRRASAPRVGEAHTRRRGPRIAGAAAFTGSQHPANGGEREGHRRQPLARRPSRNSSSTRSHAAAATDRRRRPRRAARSWRRLAAPFQVFFVGDPRGAQLQLSARDRLRARRRTPARGCVSASGGAA